MRIKLNNDYTVYLDGVHPTSFAAGQETEMPIRIAQVLLEDGRASLPGAARAEAKMDPGAPENKMLHGVPEWKDAESAGGVGQAKGFKRGRAKARS